MKFANVNAPFVMLTNIRLGWKGLPLTNSLAYLAPSLLAIKKSFATLAPGWFKNFGDTLGKKHGKAKNVFWNFEKKSF